MLRTMIATFLVYSCGMPIASAMTMRTNCDIPKHTYKTLKNRTLLQCHEDCKVDSSCKAFTHVSHWDRCFLKSASKPSFHVVMEAAMATSKHADKEKIFTPIKSQSDSTGKDFENIFSLKTSEQCQEACKGNSRCSSFVFIKGYNSCYLKLKGGKLVQKVFTCGVKA